MNNFKADHADDDLLTLGEVAAWTRVSADTLRYWRHRQTGPHSFKIGRRVFYWRSEVLRWLNEQSDERKRAS